MNGLRAWLVVVAVGASVVMEVNPGVAAEPLDGRLLKPGESVAWSGEYVDTGTNGPFDMTYPLRTTDDGGRLRVALDVVQDYKDGGRPHENADQGRDFELQILDAASQQVVRSGSVNTGYSIENFVCFNGDPCATTFSTCELCFGEYGTALPGDSAKVWTIRVTGNDIDGWTFRMRAMLERQPNPAVIAGMSERVEPNLRARPPFELTLNCRPTMGYGAFVRSGTCGTVPEAPADVPPGCSAQEVAESPDPVQWCLRFSGGNENLGHGGLEIVASNTRSEEGKVVADAVQVIRARDETVLERLPAGQLVFEDSHGHWHYDGFMQYDLFAVVQVDDKLALQQRSEGIKRGWCPADEFIADWYSFNQVPQFTGPTTEIANCFLATPDARFGQSAGWGDIYEWAREEQFVPFEVAQNGGPEKGLYVLRETVDPGGLLKESGEKDNSAYAYFEVLDGGKIRIIERGYGQDPWDPHRSRN